MDDDYGFTFEGDNFGTAEDAMAANPFQSDAQISGDAFNFPVVSNAPSQNSDGPFTGVGNILGTIGTTARDAGTVVGQLQSDFKNAGKNFSAAKNAASNQNKLSQWWLYADTGTKVTVIIGVVGIALMIHYKG